MSETGKAGFKPACAPTHLPVRQRTQTGADRRRQAQTGADRRRQDILATHGYENTDWFFNMVLCVFMVKENLYDYQ